MTQLILVTCLGALLEFFDLGLVLLFSNELAAVFLPDSGVQSFLWIFAVFALGYITRPLGGVIFSHFGDRVGRKRLFRLSILIMSGSTLAVGLLPGFEQIGVSGFILLIIFRALQGASVGGELPGAIVFAAEHLARKYRGLITAAIISSATLGGVLAATAGLLISHWLNPEQVQAWGWRVAFIAGSVVGILGYYLRKNLAETPVFLQLLAQEKICSFPIVDLIELYFKNVLSAISLTAVSGFFVSLFLFIPTYGVRYHGLSNMEAYTLAASSMLAVAGLSLFLALQGYLWSL